MQELLGYVRLGDIVIVHSMDRLARNLDDLRDIVRKLTSRGVKVQFIKENLIFSGDDSAMSQLLLSVMGAFAEFERSLIKERQREGIEAAKKRGAYQGRQRCLFSYLRRKAKKSGGSALDADDYYPGSVTFIQRFGSALNLNPHLHSQVSDGVYVRHGG